MPGGGVISMLTAPAVAVLAAATAVGVGGSTETVVFVLQAVSKNKETNNKMRTT